MNRRFLGIACVMGILAPAAAWAQDSSGSMTWVRHYRANPGHEMEFVKFVLDVSGDTMDGLLRDGSIRSWGIAVPFTHSGEAWTHAIWISTKDWTMMDDVMEAFEQADAARGKERNQEIGERFREIVAPGSVYDEVFLNVATTEQQPASAAVPKYIRASRYKVRPGQATQTMELYREMALPVYEKLVADGVIIDAGLGARQIVSDGDWTHMSWMSCSNLGAMDQVRRAFQQANAARSEDEREELEETMEELLDPDAYRSKILRIVHLGGQPASGGPQASAAD